MVKAALLTTANLKVFNENGVKLWSHRVRTILYLRKNLETKQKVCDYVCVNICVPVRLRMCVCVYMCMCVRVFSIDGEACGPADDVSSGVV